jgi:hypothetical protein
MLCRTLALSPGLKVLGLMEYVDTLPVEKD